MSATEKQTTCPLRGQVVWHGGWEIKATLGANAKPIGARQIGSEFAFRLDVSRVVIRSVDTLIRRAGAKDLWVQRLGVSAPLLPLHHNRSGLTRVMA